MPDDDVYASVLSVRVKVFYSITLALNVICTCVYHTLRFTGTRALTN